MNKTDKNEEYVYNFKIPTGKHMLTLSRERSIDARLNNLINYEKDSLKRVVDHVIEEKE